MNVNLQKWLGGLAVLLALLAAAPLASAKDAPKPKAPPSDWRKYIFEDIKAPTPRPKPSSALPGVGSLSGSRVPVAKDAPPPTAPPTVWLKYINEDYKPKPRPKPSSALPGVGSLSGSRVPVAKDAPPPTAPPTVQLEYINKDYKPTPRPKETQTESRPARRGVGGLRVVGGSPAPTAKDAPKPTDPPSDWRKYIFEDIKAPTPRPKPSSGVPQAGVLPLRTTPSATTFPPKRPPYVHPRDLKDFTGDFHRQIQGPPPPR